MRTFSLTAFESWQAVHRGTHETILQVFAGTKTCKICLLGVSTQSPLQGPLRSLAKRSACGAARPARALDTGDLTGWIERRPYTHDEKRP